MSLTSKQTDRLDSLVAELTALIGSVDQAGAEEVLESLYVLITEVYEKFPALDVEEE
jgi:hypothetical protein